MIRNYRKIMVCPNCGTPLISTFLFPGAEWFCMKCKARGGLIGFGKEVVATKELLSVLYPLRKKFERHASHIWIGGAFKVGCSKCITQGQYKSYHAWHLTPEEKVRQDNSVKALGL
jgi:ribosomal protein L37AE/L43A